MMGRTESFVVTWDVVCPQVPSKPSNWPVLVLLRQKPFWALKLLFDIVTNMWWQGIFSALKWSLQEDIWTGHTVARVDPHSAVPLESPVIWCVQLCQPGVFHVCRFFQVIRNILHLKVTCNTLVLWRAMATMRETVLTVPILCNCLLCCMLNPLSWKSGVGGFSPEVYDLDLGNGWCQLHEYDNPTGATATTATKVTEEASVATVPTVQLVWLGRSVMLSWVSP